MPLQQNTLIDKIELIETGVIQVRQRSDIFDTANPSNIIAFTYDRWALYPGEDLSKQDPKVIAIAKAVWTDDVVQAYSNLVNMHQKGS